MLDFLYRRRLSWILGVAKSCLFSGNAKTIVFYRQVPPPCNRVVKLVVFCTGSDSDLDSWFSNLLTLDAQLFSVYRSSGSAICGSVKQFIQLGWRKSRFLINLGSVAWNTVGEMTALLRELYLRHHHSSLPPKKWTPSSCVVPCLCLLLLDNGRVETAIMSGSNGKSN